MMRRTRYFLASGPMRQMVWMLAPLLRKGLQACSDESYAEVRIITFDRHGHSEPSFAASTIAALRLLESVDPRRFRRVQRYIKVIRVDNKLRSLGAYDPVFRCCAVDYRGFKSEEHLEWHAWRYATLLVHESTHGALHARWIPYSAKTRVRIERLCCIEERRFAARADNHERQWSVALVKDFDERNWHESWNDNIFKRFKGWFMRQHGTR